MWMNRRRRWQGTLSWLLRVFLFRKRAAKIGIYGPPNAGKTTLANRIIHTFVDENDDMGTVSEIPHETRRAIRREGILIDSRSKLLPSHPYFDFNTVTAPATEQDQDQDQNQNPTSASRSTCKSELPQKQRREQKSRGGEGRGKLRLDIVDTPGLATKIDFHDFMSFGLEEKEAKKRAKEATEGVIDAIKWLNDIDGVVLLMDSTEDPYTQTNIVIIGNLEARGIPMIIAANKIDHAESAPQKIADAFPQHTVVPISALKGDNMEGLYMEMTRRFK